LRTFSVDLLHRVLGKLGYLKNNGTSLWYFVPNSGLGKFRHGTPTVGVYDCRMLIALGVQLCIQRDGRLGVKGIVARSIGVS